jgi:hypothetical protein
VDAQFVLWFKIWQSQSEDDKIFIDNEITIAVEKIFSLFSWNNSRVLWRNKRKGFILTIQCK